MDSKYLLGVDGGGTRCRARLCRLSGAILGEGEAGPANIRFGIEESYTAVLEATAQCLAKAGLDLGDCASISACLALAGAGDPATLSELKGHKHPFRWAVFTTDSHAACVGAHRGKDGGIVIVGTGSIGEAVVKGRHHRVGGWGFPVSDEGSGAWLGCELARRVLWAHDGRIPWTELLRRAFEHFASDPHAIVRWMGPARTKDFASLAPLVIEHAAEDDLAACELMGLAANHIEILVKRLTAMGAPRVALSGGLAASIEPWLSERTRRGLVAPAADALAGAVDLARTAVLSEAAA
ncbi:MAG: BadF/BadG/BcrA/BcrD ATPase family protein [Rhodomicrobium sp.]